MMVKKKDTLIKKKICFAVLLENLRRRVFINGSLLGEMDVEGFNKD